VRYFVSFEGQTAPLEIDVKELPSGALEVSSGGKRIDVDLAVVGSALSLRVDGHVIDLTTEGTPPDLGVVASGHRSYVRVESDRQRAAEAAHKHSGGGADDLVRSPMPGRIVRVLVAVGDEVAVGQPLVVVEAMKMENELKSKRAGRVVEILVAQGAAVEGNAKLLRLA
jgi:glutaconyl-CoA/methylmalonyl-CoA decarboxylase subunit gamma